MYDLSFTKELRDKIRKKLDEHIQQILDKPTISIEEHQLLEMVDKQYADIESEILRSAQTGKSVDIMWIFVMLYIILSGFGGDK